MMTESSFAFCPKIVFFCLSGSDFILTVAIYSTAKPGTELMGFNPAFFPMFSRAEVAPHHEIGFSMRLFIFVS
jgi:hypothetical protein